MYLIQIYESLKDNNIIYENKKDYIYNSLQYIFTYPHALGVVNNYLWDILRINEEFGKIRKMISYNGIFKTLNQIMLLKC